MYPKLLLGCASIVAIPLTVPADDYDDEEEIPFEVAEVFFELNNIDRDLGIHALVDGEPWKRLTIEDTRDQKMLNIHVRGRLRRQGLTAIFFESAEPPFEDLAPAAFFHRFPEGIHDVEGATLDGEHRHVRPELTDPDPEVRLEAVLAASELATATAVQLLAPAVYDPAPAVREAAEAVLEDLGATEYLPMDRLTQ